jgi:gentisate 1,2-dioxygenase
MGDLCDNSKKFFESLPQHHVAPLWTVLNAVNPPRPAPKAVPTLWKYKELRPPLMEAGKIVTAEEAERRVLMLVNPAMSELNTHPTHARLILFARMSCKA